MKNQTGKYFKYAIGEIVLVVIGILIALQINNWNNNRIAKNIEINQIQQLLEDARADSVFFESRKLFLSDTDSYQSMVLNMYDSTQVDSISKLKISDNSKLFGSRLAYQSHVVFNNEDAIDIIKSDSLKRQLKRYYAKYEYVATAIELSNKTLEKYGVPLWIKYPTEFKELDTDSLMHAHLPLLKYKDIQPNIELSQRFIQNSLNQVNEFSEQNAVFIQVLEDYLKKENN